MLIEGIWETQERIKKKKKIIHNPISKVDYC